MRSFTTPALVSALFAACMLGGAGCSRGAVPMTTHAGSRESRDLHALDALVVGETSEEAFLGAGWSFRAGTEGRVGLLAVLWDHAADGRSVHSYMLGNCSGMAAKAALEADAALLRARKSEGRTPTWDLLFCPSPHGKLLRYVQFREGRLFKIETPHAEGGDLDRFAVGVTTEEQFLKLGWSVDTARRFGLGIAGVALENFGSHSVATYFLDLRGTARCSALSDQEVQGADSIIGFLFANRDRFTDPVERMFCPGPRAREHRLRFRDGVLVEVELPEQ